MKMITKEVLESLTLKKLVVLREWVNEEIKFKENNLQLEMQKLEIVGL